MTELRVEATVHARLSWDYDVANPRVLALYEQARHAQWDPGTDVDWSIDVDFGAPLPDDSAFALSAFEASPMRRYGRPMWDTFRWEFQTWMVSQFLHGEQGALVATARLAEVLPELDSKFFATTQAVDEARHVEVFARYLRDKVPHSYEVSAPLAALLHDLLADSRWDITALGMQIIVEGLAMAAFRLANSTFQDDLIRRIAHLVARDEARHVSFGVLALEGLYEQMTSAELHDREEFLLDAAHLMQRRFLLDDVWDRLGVDRDEGMEFAATNELMVKYRQATFAKVVSALNRIGLMTDRVREGFSDLGLLGYAGNRVMQGAVGP